MKLTEQNKIRTFIALEIPDEIRETIDRCISSKLRKCRTKCSWVKPDNIHLTLKFLGDTPVNIIDSITNDVRFVLEGLAPINLCLDRVGTFGGRKPRVVWAGLSGETESLELIANTIDEITFKHGFKREKRRFSPHLTVGRIRKQIYIPELLTAIENIQFERLDFTADKISFIKSELTPKGSIYTPLHEFILR